MLTIDDFKRRVSTAITPSAMRNQGKGTMKKAQAFAAAMEIERFARVTDAKSFQQELEQQTQLLADLLGKPRNWGAARKALNIYLCEAFYHRVLFAEYNLGHIGPFLEVVLDSRVAGELASAARNCGINLTTFPYIKDLTPEISREYQEFASSFAKQSGFVLRVELEIRYW